jgi:hypothetical protein
MTWNYRVMNKDGEFAIYEVFYRDDGSVEGYTDSPVFPRADSASGLIEEFRRYTEALGHEVLMHE